MVLSSWQSHCESSPGSFDECRLSAKVATNPQTKPTDLDCESKKTTKVDKNMQLRRELLPSCGAIYAKRHSEIIISSLS